MNSRKLVAGLTLLIITVAFISTIAARHTQNQALTQEQQRLDFESQFPIADYDSPVPAALDELAKRQLRSSRFDKSSQAIDPTNAAEVTTDFSHWAAGLPALPVDKSSAVVIGEMADANAYLSNDKTGVYAEFVLHVDKVLKDDSKQLTTGCSILVARAGGRVRFPTGRIGQYFTAGQGMPRVGQRYVLFLVSSEEQKYFYILTGYELREGHILLLDNPGSGHPITAYKGKDELSLLKDIQAAMAKTSQATPGK